MNEDNWITGVESPYIRSSIIVYLLDLMDPVYQQREWIKEDWETSFRENLWFSVDMIFNELNLDYYLEEKKIPYERIGIYLKDEKEAEALYKVAEVMDQLMQDVYQGNSEMPKNEKYLSSPYLPMLHEASKEAFEIFMENEKDNKEFCEFIEDLKKKEGR